MLQDSGRPGKPLWTSTLLQRGDVSGILLSPFDTPTDTQPRRLGARDLIDRVTDAGGEVLFDPTTHGALLPSTSRWASYDTWDLWDGPRSDLSTQARLRGHVLRTLEVQLDLGLPPVAPALALASAVGLDADRSLEMATTARSQGNEVHLAIVGSGAFWSQGHLLDDYVGQIAQLRPAGVFFSVIRPDLDYPPQAMPAEITGLCRSVDSLSRRCDVIVQCSDLFGLPALAAGASAIGSGWDLRQRMLAPVAFQHGTTTRRTSHRVTHAGLYGVLKRPEAELLLRNDRALSVRLVPGAVPGNGNPLWERHLGVLALEASSIQALPDRRAKATWLLGRYTSALADFARVDVLARPLAAGSARWLSAVKTGLEGYMAGEGW